MSGMLEIFFKDLVTLVQPSSKNIYVTVIYSNLRNNSQ